MPDDAILSERQAAQREHFIRRARERFGLRVSPARYQAFAALVTENGRGTKFLGHQPPNRTVWRIRAGGHWMRVVYDHYTDRLVTCLPYCERSEHGANPHRLRRLQRRGRIRKWN